MAQLVDNALRHTPANSPVRVALSQDADRVCLTIEDEGPGIDPCDRERVFRPFEQGDTAAASPDPGTGIGLAFVRRTVELHGGRVWVDDADGAGARFRIELPAVNSSAVVPRPDGHVGA